MDPELRIALVGYGAMGHEIEKLAPQQNCLITAVHDIDSPLTISSAADFDVAVEFTHPDALAGNVRTLCALGKPIVTGTTGWLDNLEQVTGIVRQSNGRMLYASNFSVGVNIFFKILRHAARAFNSAAMYDAALHELHHVRKADAPSGTALTAAQIMLAELERKTHLLTETSHGRIAPDALHLTSQRVGQTAGTHSAVFDSEADTIEIVHRAKNRSGFALGALMAARQIVSMPPGVYRFEDLF